MSRVVGKDIERALKERLMVIDPLEPKRIRSASVTLTLGSSFLVYLNTSMVRRDGDHLKLSSRKVTQAQHELRPGTDNWLSVIDLSPRGEVSLEPGTFCVMHTAEKLSAPSCEVHVTGAAELARLGIVITPMVIEPPKGKTFDPVEVALGVSATQPVRLPVGMEFCEARFYELVEHH